MSKEGSKNGELNFTLGEIISGYKLVQKIDEGGFGQVFKVTKDNKTYAMKLESNSQEGGSAIKLEIDVLKGLIGESVFPALVTGGKKVRYHYLVLELLGDNLKVLRIRSGGVLTEKSWSRLGIQCLYVLKVMHNRGFLHRDIKPSNFALAGNTGLQSRHIKLFDFGLARRFVKKEKAKNSTNSMEKVRRSKAKRTEEQKDKTKTCDEAETKAAQDVKDTCTVEKDEVEEFRIARPRTDFRGTYQYASLNAHRLMELGRHDDLWSLLFMICEMYTELPWAASEGSAVEAIKQDCTLVRLYSDDNRMDYLSPDMRKQLDDIEENLNDCHYYSYPKYDLLYDFLLAVMKKSEVEWCSEYDWEKEQYTNKDELASLVKSASKEKNPWEKPGNFFKVDKWKHLKSPLNPLPLGTISPAPSKKKFIEPLTATPFDSLAMSPPPSKVVSRMGAVNNRNVKDGSVKKSRYGIPVIITSKEGAGTPSKSPSKEGARTPGKSPSREGTVTPSKSTSKDKTRSKEESVREEKKTRTPKNGSIWKKKL